MKEAYLRSQEDRINELKAELDRLNQLLAKRKEEKIKSKNEKVKTDDIIRGSIVKVLVDLNNDEEFKLFKLSRQQFRDQKLKGLEEHVVYVDLDKASCKIFVRCKSKEAAEAVLHSTEFLTTMNKQLLSVDEEDTYFERIFANRSKKLDKKDKKQAQPQVGVTKVPEAVVPKPVKKAATEPAAHEPPAKKASHIKFDDDD